MKKHYLTKFLTLALLLTSLVGYGQAPTAGPTDPTRNASDVTSIYSDVYGNIPNLNTGAFGIPFNPTDINGNNVLALTNLTFAGMQWNEFDVTNRENLHIDYYIDAEASATLNWFLISPGQENGFAIDETAEFAVDTWISIDIPLTAYTAPDLTRIFQFKADTDVQPLTGTVYVDNIYFWSPPPPPGSDATLSDLTVGGSTVADFSSSTEDYIVELPAGTTTAPLVAATVNDMADGGATTVITQAASVPGTATVVVTSQNTNVTKTYTVDFVINTPSMAAPASTALNASDVVSVYADGYADQGGAINWDFEGPGSYELVDINGRPTHKYSDLNFAKVLAPEKINAGDMNRVRFDYWTPDATQVGINIVNRIEGGATSNGQVKIDNSAIREWATFDMPLSSFSGLNATSDIDIFDFVAAQNGSNETLFIDNFYFYKAEEPTELGALSQYCETVVQDNNSTPGSDVVLTIENLSSTELTVSVEAVAGDTDISQLLVQLGGFASASQVEVDGKFTSTLVYNSPAPTSIDNLQLLWERPGTPGLQQLNVRNIPFEATCTVPDALNVTTSATTTTDISCGDLNISAGAVYTVASGTTLSVLGSIIGDGELVVNSGGSLITYNGKNTGSATIQRNTTGQGNYSFVGSPVAGDPGITGSDLGSIVYSYNETTPFGQDGLARWEDASATQLVPGVGYAQAGGSSISFSGVPNDGTITVSGLTHTAPDDSHSEHGWNILSNPYPAAIDVDAFISHTANSDLNGSIYLWDDHGSNTGIRGTNADYLTVNNLAVVGGPNGGLFNGYIGSMQGFFVKVSTPSADASVEFTETMRVGGVNTDGSFFRKSKEKPVSARLSIQTADGLFNELVVGLKDDATTGIDRMYDADKFISNTGFQFYSLISGEKFAIQGLPLESGVSTELGFDLGAAAELTLNVQELNSLEAGMTFFLRDSKTGKVYDLSNTSSFTFSATEGADQNRFTLTYTMAGVLSAELIQDAPIYRYLNNTMNVRFNENVKVQGFAVYDLSGKVINKSELNGGELNEINIPVQNEGVTIIKIITTEGTFTRKFLF